MIFLASKNSVEAISLQKTLLESYNYSIDLFSSIYKVEENLFRRPDIIFIDENLETSDLISLTQSIKAYDPQIQVVWICRQGSPYLEQIYKSYGVYHCLKKEIFFVERLSLMITEIWQQPSQKSRREKRKMPAKRISLHKPSSFHHN